LPADARINLIGHSYGGDTAAKAAAAASRPINLLVTIDPVSLIRPSKATVEAHVNHWIDVDAVTGGRGGVANDIAGIGGAWNAWPEGTANVFARVAADHNEFTKMMTTPGPDGLTPQQALKETWKPRE
jgi:pimeloyl-ACP methyl ester carboxylesterase